VKLSSSSCPESSTRSVQDSDIPCTLILHCLHGAHLRTTSVSFTCIAWATFLVNFRHWKDGLGHESRPTPKTIRLAGCAQRARHDINTSVWQHFLSTAPCLKQACCTYEAGPAEISRNNMSSNRCRVHEVSRAWQRLHPGECRQKVPKTHSFLLTNIRVPEYVRVSLPVGYRSTTDTRMSCLYPLRRQ